MLRALSIHDILLIERLELDFQPGLNVLTGETGAGKSILLDCLGFVLGWRGRADLTRHGTAQGEVTAVFELPSDHSALGVLEDAGLSSADELILRRTNSAEGRKRAFINDRPVSGDVLRQLSEHLVELHGQHDDKGLLNPRSHRAMLDRFGGLGAELQAVGTAWKAKQKAAQALDEATNALEEAARDAEYLRHSAEELHALSPEEGEEPKLDKERRLMQAAERIRGDVERASQAVSGEGAEGQIADAMRWLETAAEKAEGMLDAPLAALSRSLNELSEAERQIGEALDRLRTDPAALEQIEERLFAIRGLARKHNVQPDELPDLAADFAARLTRIELGEEEITRLRVELTEAETSYDRAADKLSEARHLAAEKLDKAVMAELAPLKLERAEFVTELAEHAAGPEGCDQVRFTVATNPGAPAGPIDRIASGGELSRFLLALKVCLTAQTGGQTLIFDEIDRGVGGATADAVGRRLAALADKEQVIVVTHSPQVAARGAHHWQVSKAVEGEETLTDVAKLGEAKRIDEIARMLAGEMITDEAKQAAKALLAG